jgi:hypothetical protein
MASGCARGCWASGARGTRRPGSPACWTGGGTTPFKSGASVSSQHARAVRTRRLMRVEMHAFNCVRARACVCAYVAMRPFDAGCILSPPRTAPPHPTPPHPPTPHRGFPGRTTCRRACPSCRSWRCPSCPTCRPTCWWTSWTRVRGPRVRARPACCKICPSRLFVFLWSRKSALVRRRLAMGAVGGRRSHWYRGAVRAADAGAALAPSFAGDVAALVVPQTRSVTASVRAAATSALGAILLQPDIQGALATTPGERGAKQGAAAPPPAFHRGV